MAFYAEEVRLILLGQEWMEAAVYVRIFGVAAMIRPAIGTSAVVLITCGQSTRFLVLAVAHGVVLTILLFLGLGWGPEGVALAHVATTIVLMIPKLYFSFMRTPATLRGFLSAVWPTVVAGAAMVTGLIALRSLHIGGGFVVSLLVGASVGGALYLLALGLQPRGRAELGSLFVDVRAALDRKRRARAGSD